MADFDDMLNFDALSAAEKITGSSYKEDKTTETLGLLLHLNAVETKREELALRNDTYYSCPLAYTLQVFADLGFKIIHQHAFPGNHAEETYYVLWHPTGVLGTIESYAWGDDEPSTNNAKIYYNWRSNGGDSWALMSSGTIRDGVMIGYRDVREGLRHYMGRYLAEGEFLPVWVERPFMWLVDYSQTEPGLDYKGITNTLIESLPIEIQEAIRG